MNAGQHLDICHKTIWLDGGTSIYSTLEEKSQFYQAAYLLSEFLKYVISEMNEEILFIGDFCEMNNYESWKDSKKYYCYNMIKSIFNNRSCYELKIKELDGELDYIVENNLRYFSCFNIYLPNSKILFVP